MKRLLLCLLLVPCLCCGAERPSGEDTSVHVRDESGATAVLPAANPDALQRAQEIIDRVRGKPTDSRMVEDFIAGFVLKAAQEGNKNAPVDGDLKKQAQFYLLYLDAIHRDMFRIKRQTVAAQKADEEARAALAE